MLSSNHNQSVSLVVRLLQIIATSTFKGAAGSVVGVVSYSLTQLLCYKQITTLDGEHYSLDYTQIWDILQGLLSDDYFVFICFGNE